MFLDENNGAILNLMELKQFSFIKNICLFCAKSFEITSLTPLDHLAEFSPQKLRLHIAYANTGYFCCVHYSKKKLVL